MKSRTPEKVAARSRGKLEEGSPGEGYLAKPAKGAPGGKREWELQLKGLIKYLINPAMRGGKGENAGNWFGSKSLRERGSHVLRRSPQKRRGEGERVGAAWDSSSD